MNLLKDFAVSLKVEEDLSSNTIAGYTKDVENFIAYVNRDLKDVTPSDVRSFIAHLSEEGMKRNTITRALSSLKSFYRFLVNIDKSVSVDPTKDVKLGSREKSLPKALSKSDAARLLETASKDSIKSRVVVELLYGLGGRVSEIASLRVEDIDFEECYVRIVGKGNKERHNPIHEGCIDLIQRYMATCRITEGYLFPHRLDKTRHATRESIYNMVKKLAVKSDLDPTIVSPHVLRHSFATHMLDNGCDMAIVQEFLGHEDIATTKIYARVTRGNKSNNFKNFHPLA